MNHVIAPPTMTAPAASYAHAVLSVAPARLLHTSGVVPVRADGTVPDKLADQAAAVWENLRTLLHAGGFDVADVVSVTTYVVSGNDLSVVMKARDEALGGHLAASTLVVVPELARPEWRMEISLVAVDDHPGHDRREVRSSDAEESG